MNYDHIYGDLVTQMKEDLDEATKIRPRYQKGF